jgi:hypothetical protein
MDNLFDSILGQQLSAVTFVQDYLQLHFDGNILTCYSWPFVITASETYTIHTDGYRDALCNIITSKVIAASLKEEDSLDICFHNDVVICLNLIRDTVTKDLPEFAYFNSADDKWFVLD